MQFEPRALLGPVGRKLGKQDIPTRPECGAEIIEIRLDVRLQQQEVQHSTVQPEIDRWQLRGQRLRYVVVKPVDARVRVPFARRVPLATEPYLQFIERSLTDIVQHKPVPAAKQFIYQTRRPCAGQEHIEGIACRNAVQKPECLGNILFVPTQFGIGRRSKNGVPVFGVHSQVFSSSSSRRTR